MSNDVKRMRYFDGLFLTEDEFKLEQEYLLRKRRFHNRHLHGQGIVYGLELEVGTLPLDVNVKAGMALDLYTDPVSLEELSREVVVPLDITLDLTSGSYVGPADVYLWINYSEGEIDPGSGPRYWEESYSLGHSTSKPVDTGLNVLLGRVVIDGGGSITSVEELDVDGITQLRKYPGLTGKETRVEGYTFRDLITSDVFATLTKQDLPGGERGLVLGGDFLHLNSTLGLAKGAFVNELSSDGTLVDDSNLALPTEQAVKTYVDQKVVTQNLQAVPGVMYGGLEFIGDPVTHVIRSGVYGIKDKTIALQNDLSFYDWSDLYGDPANPIPGAWYFRLLDASGNTKTCLATGAAKSAAVNVTGISGGVFTVSQDISPTGLNWAAGNPVQITGFAADGLPDGFYLIDTIPGTTTFTIQYTTPPDSVLAGMARAFLWNDGSDTGANADHYYYFTDYIAFDSVYQGFYLDFLPDYRALGVVFLKSSLYLDQYRILSFGHGKSWSPGTKFYSRGLDTTYTLTVPFDSYEVLESTRLYIEIFSGQVCNLGLSSNVADKYEPSFLQMWNTTNTFGLQDFILRLFNTSSHQAQLRIQHNGRASEYSPMIFTDSVYCPGGKTDWYVDAGQTSWSHANSKLSLRGFCLFCEIP